MSPDLWSDVRKKLHQYPTVLITGTLLVRVQYRYDEHGRMVGVIPQWVQDEANKHGLLVSSADYEKDQYEVCLLTR